MKAYLQIILFAIFIVGINSVDACNRNIQNADEDVCRNFEKKFAVYVKEHNLTEEIIYLNLGYDSDENGLLQKVYSKYKSDKLIKKVYEYPTLIIFNQGKIVDVLSSNGKNKITIDQVNDFLESYEL